APRLGAPSGRRQRTTSTCVESTEPAPRAPHAPSDHLHVRGEHPSRPAVLEGRLFVLVPLPQRVQVTEGDELQAVEVHDSAASFACGLDDVALLVVGGVNAHCGPLSDGRADLLPQRVTHPSGYRPDVETG